MRPKVSDSVEVKSNGLGKDQGQSQGHCQIRGRGRGPDQVRAPRVTHGRQSQLVYNTVIDLAIFFSKSAFPNHSNYSTGYQN